ncbi:hypothetical protein [Vibrio crassostreae]|uniref:hypothetical protein n=1 Tax=Vibrio crassostreae TaxID=246167 RepID=UPI000660EBD7|nr:hypothetical protein [Vibrio crassostreae]
MEEISIELSEAENVLRECFEAGIAYNLIFGRLDFRRQSGLVHLRRLLAEIPLVDRPHYYGILERAFDPRYDALCIVMSHLDPTSPFSGQLASCVHVLLQNYPKVPFKLFLTAAATTNSVIQPKEIVRAYYQVRTELGNIDSRKLFITVTDPTIIKLYELVNERQLTSNLIRVEYGQTQDNITPFRIHSYDLFTKQRNITLDNKEFSLGQIHWHLIEIARKLDLGQDPLKDVPHPLLDGKKYTQWAPMLHALCRYYENSTPTKYYKKYSDKLPKIYEHELDSKSIIPQLNRLSTRENSLHRYLNPHPNDFAQTQQKQLEQMAPALVQKMVICHMIMFYFSVMKNASWYSQVRECINKLKKSHPENYLSKLLTLPVNSEHTDDVLLNNLKELFHSNPVGLFPWMFGDALPDPMELMKHYFSHENSDNIEYITKRNMYFKDLKLADSALLIPMYLSHFDSSQWMKPAIMAQLPSENLQTCIFYAPESTSKELSLYLAGLLCKGQYAKETLEERLTMKVSKLENLLLGICFLWQNTFDKKTSVSKFVDTLQVNEISEISERTLNMRADKAKYWLEQWPRVSLFHEKL